MTNRLTRMALASLVAAAIAPGAAPAQYGRGGMVGNRGNFAGNNRANFGQQNFNRANNNVNVGIRQNNVTIINQPSVNVNNNRPGYGRPG